jgi:dinuclear metal center YbgI/SA1388 family protein
MTVTVADLIGIMEQIAPPALSEGWDNVGLQVGRRDWPVRRVWISLDPIPPVVSAAVDAGVDLLITHHPLIFKAPKTIDFATPLGQIIQHSARHGLSIYSAHTNLDIVSDGINDILAARIDLTDLVPLEDPPPGAGKGEGLGRVGNLAMPTTLMSLARRIKESMGLTTLRCCGKPDLPVRRAAVCSGSGASLMGAFFASGADVYISGDMKYHDARDVESAGLGLIDMGHFASEHLVVDVLTRRLKAAVEAKSMPVAVEACSLESDPFIAV